MKLKRVLLFSVTLIFLMPWTSVAQQQQTASIIELKQQIAKLEEVDRAPNTLPDVRNLNRTFLDKRRSELRGLLISRRDTLRSYLTSNRAILRAEEVSRVESALIAIETDLQNLSATSTDSGGGQTVGVAATGGETRARMTTISSEASLPAVSDSLPTKPQCSTAADQVISNVVIATGVFNAGTAQNVLEITLSSPLSLTNQPADVKVIGRGLRIPGQHFKVTVQTDSGTLDLSPKGNISVTDRRVFFINLSGTIPEGAKNVTVIMTDLAIECPSAASPTLIAAATKAGNIAPSDTLQEGDIAALNEANKKAAAKRSDEKNFRMGFMAAKGDGENADGAADISINKTFFGGGQASGTVLDFFDQADVALQVKKSSAEKTDARQMVLGLNLRKTFLIDSRLSSNDVGKKRSDVSATKKNKGFFRVLMITEALNLEGEAFDFKTTNFVSDTNLELASIAKKLGSGFYNLSIFAGPELGRNLSKPDAATTVGATAEQLSRVDWITRLKAGGEFTLRLLPSASGDNWGIEFNGAFVNRTLYNSEIFTEQTTDAGENKIKTVTIGRGNKAWRQANLKVFLFGNERARYGVNLSYMNGRLPPAFAPTKGFQFGLLVESADDKQSGEAANSDK